MLKWMEKYYLTRCIYWKARGNVPHPTSTPCELAVASWLVSGIKQSCQAFNLPMTLSFLQLQEHAHLGVCGHLFPFLIGYASKGFNID